MLGLDPDLTTLLPIYERICQFILSGCFLLLFGLFEDIVYNVIITDANATGFCGILFKLCRTDAADSKITKNCCWNIRRLRIYATNIYWTTTNALCSRTNLRDPLVDSDWK
jgi:hypothetical protein